MKALGLQLFTVRENMKTEADIRETFKKLREIGYTEAQTALAGVSNVELGKIAKEEGIKIVGVHCPYAKMLDFEQLITDLKALDTTNCGVGSFRGKTLAELRQFIKEANELANRLYEHGIKFTYHNHDHEFVKWDGNKTMFDILVEGLDPRKTSFVLDTGWMQFGGCDVRHWMELLEGRIDILHLKDISRTENKERPIIFEEIGNGNLWWDGIMDVAKKIGIKYYCVEQDNDYIDGDPFKSLKVSADYLQRYMEE